jgi:hypothetical protein
MKTRITLLVVALSFVFAACGAAFFVAPEKKDAVKKVAVVQYAINPHMLMGPVQADDAKFNVAAKNLETFGKELGNTYQVVPSSEVLANAGYTGAGGKPTWDGFYSGKGMHYFSADEDSLTQATLTPDVAKKLCEALGVDGVVAIYDSWQIQTFAMGFQGHSLPSYTINLFDKSGARVWGGQVSGESETAFATPAGVISTDVDTWTKANAESFTVAMGQVKTNIGAK